MNPSTATSSQANGSIDDFANKNNATGATGTGDNSAATATWNVSPTSTTIAWRTGGTRATRMPGTSRSRTGRAAYVIEGTSSDANAANYTGNGHAQLVLNGYPDIPANVVPTSVTLNVRHKESTSTTSNVALLEVNVLDSSNNQLCTADIKAGNDLRTSYGTDSYDVSSCLNTADARERRASSATRARARAPPAAASSSTACP